MTPGQQEERYQANDEIMYAHKPSEVLYFTNRLEIGKNSVYDKLETCSHQLHNTRGPATEEKKTIFDRGIR